LRRESINVDDRQRHRELTGGWVLVVDRCGGAATAGEIAEIPLISANPTTIGMSAPSELYVLSNDPRVGTTWVCDDVGQGRRREYRAQQHHHGNERRRQEPTRGVPNVVQSASFRHVLPNRSAASVSLAPVHSELSSATI